MEGSEDAKNDFIKTNKWFTRKAESSSKTAEGIATLRLHESHLPEGERILYDPYAVHFISPEILEWIASNPDKVKARWKQRERILTGIDNSVIARVRYFDDFVNSAIIFHPEGCYLPTPPQNFLLYD